MFLPDLDPLKKAPIPLNQSFGKCSFPNHSSVQELSHAEVFHKLV